MYDGQVVPVDVFDPVLALGLALQVPFGFLALRLARTLGRLAEKIGRALAVAPPRFVALTLARVRPSASDLPRIPALALGYAGRGPPSRF